MKKENKYEVTMDVKWWSGGYGTKTMEFEDEDAFHEWYGSRSEIIYKVIGIINQGYKNN